MSTGVRWLSPVSVDGQTYLEIHRVVEAVMRGGGAVGFRGVPTRVETETWLDAILDRVHRGTARFAVVTWRDTIAGLGRWERYEGPLVAVNADVRQVMVDPAGRRRGMARSLVAALVADARDQGVETLTLDVRGNNHAAMALYESLGFVVAGRLPDFVAVGADRFDRVNYRLDLRPPDAAVRRLGGLARGAGGAPLLPGHQA